MIKRIYLYAPATFTFILISGLALVLAHFTSGASNRLLFSVYRASWTEPLAYLRIFTHVLGHADLAHYASNFGYLVIILGIIMERKHGTENFIVFVLLTALISGAIHLIFRPANYALLGASGVVFMLVMLTTYTFLHKIKWGKHPVLLYIIITLYIGGEIFLMVGQAAGFISNNISYSTHIVGGVCGIIFGAVAQKLKTDEKRN
jgi:GlpG protein